jgi:hypothetical protein
MNSFSRLLLSSVLALFGLGLPVVALSQMVCNGCPVPGSQQSAPLLMPGAGLPTPTQTNPAPNA